MVQRSPAQTAAIYLFLALFAAVTFVPIFWMLSSSFKSLDKVLTVRLQWIPDAFHFENYTQIWSAEHFGTYFLNSFFVAAAVTALTLLLSSLTGYGLAKFDFPGNRLVFVFILGTMMVPFQVIVIPLFVIVRSLGWANSYRGLIIPAGLSAFAVFYMRQYIKTLSDEYIDAARIDGSPEWRIYTRLVVPLSMPALSSLGILTFLASWNNLFWPLVVVQKSGLETLPLGLVKILQSQYGVRYNLLMSGAVIASLPMVAIYLVFQRGIIKGITAGGIKG
jgi:multiple sugar transport system permease protein